MKVHHQSTFDKWPFEDKSMQAIITSPPYYSLRKYDIPDIIIGGNPECEHEFTNEQYQRRSNDNLYPATSHKQLTSEGSFGRDAWILHCTCSLCSAWKGQYGLETTYQLYIEHTLLWAKEAWRVLKDDGIFFLNIGDSWTATGGPQCEQTVFKGEGDRNKGQSDGRSRKPEKGLKSKCKLLIPHRVAIGLIEQGWILRNDLIWYKTNAMPESVKDRFSKKFEYIFLFSKTGKYYFDLDSVREEHSEVSLKRIKHSWKSNHPSIGSIDVDEMGDRFCNPNGKNPGDVWTVNTQPSPEKHYAMWPESLVERMILCSTKADDSVLDPFCGSACTLRVADKLNRVAYGIDLGYQEIQKRRLSNIQKEIFP